MKILILSIVAGSAALLASTAWAQQQQQQQQPAAASAAASNSDPVICEKQEEIGSRLSTHRICMKRSQWQDQQLQDRQATERVQRSEGMPGGH